MAAYQVSNPSGPVHSTSQRSQWNTPRSVPSFVRHPPLSSHLPLTAYPQHSKVNSPKQTHTHTPNTNQCIVTSRAVRLPAAVSRHSRISPAHSLPPSLGCAPPTIYLTQTPTAPPKDCHFSTRFLISASVCCMGFNLISRAMRL